MPQHESLNKKNGYGLEDNGTFVIEDYNHSKPFSNFFPGIAGLWGVPMWAFYVNRGQCIASFGVESKDKSILEFQSANKSYRLTSLQGFRTFIQVQSGGKTVYWEPFQNLLLGTIFKKKTKLLINAHDLTLEETNQDLGLIAQVNYFTLPEEPYSALVRRLTIKNISKKKYGLEIIDGLPAIVPYGLNDWLNKNISRTVEAWVKVRNLSKKAPYYQLNVEVSDKPEVTHIKEGNFYFSFDAKTKKICEPIVEAAKIFGSSYDFAAPEVFLKGDFRIPQGQQTSNRTPCAFGYSKHSLSAGTEKQIISLLGYASEIEQVNRMAQRVTQADFIDQKAKRNKEIIDGIKSFAFTNSASSEFNLYAGHTFLDNVLRGGLPISIDAGDGPVAFNVYSRKHGDLERDYNHFMLAPTFYSQGNGNYRDVNQNRRNDVWFNTDVKDSHVLNFLNLLQADGYNPLIVKGTSFTVEHSHKLQEVLKRTVHQGDEAKLIDFMQPGFLPGDLLSFIDKNNIKLKINPKEFLGQILKICHKHELAEHGEGFWVDHWTYNLDLIESYLAIYPEELRNILFDKKLFSFYLNSHYLLPRDSHYILTKRGVRQYKSVVDAEKEIQAKAKGNKLRVRHGQGEVYHTSLLCKLLCLIANKTATFDPSGIGIEMEADKPGWYDALNGLPGLLGSSICETLELKRLCVFILHSIEQAGLESNRKVLIFEELERFILGLNQVLSSSPQSYEYWVRANDMKENYHESVRRGIDGVEKEISLADVKVFLRLVIEKADKALEKAKTDEGSLATYFYHEVTDYEIIDENKKEALPFVRPLKFICRYLPPFLEGYVHALRTLRDRDQGSKLYSQVRKSGLFDRKLKMYKVNDDLTQESEEIGRTRVFPRGWLENESIWLHMEYKFILELLRNGLYEEFYDNFYNCLVPFLKPGNYGRSILENSSFIVSSAHEDPDLHGQGFVARLSGSTAEFLHIWLLMNVGSKPFFINEDNELGLRFQPVLKGMLFTKEKTTLEGLGFGRWKKVELPANTYAFNFLGSVLIVYHNPKRLDTFGSKPAGVVSFKIHYRGQLKPVLLKVPYLGAPYAQDVREQKIERIDVFFNKKGGK